MRKVKCRADLEKLILTSTIERCSDCDCNLNVTQHRTRPLRTLNEQFLVVARDKSCPNRECESFGKPIRPVTEGCLPLLPRCEFGLDVVVFVGEGRLTGGKSQPEIHRELEEEHGVHISGRHVGNLFKIFMALVHAVNADTDVIRKMLVAQEGIILSVDGVAFDDTSPILYVLRDVLSGEILYSERGGSARRCDVGPTAREGKGIGSPHPWHHLRQGESDCIRCWSCVSRSATPVLPSALPEEHRQADGVRSCGLGRSHEGLADRYQEAGSRPGSSGADLR